MKGGNAPLDLVVVVLLEDEPGDGLEDPALVDDDVPALAAQLASADLFGRHAADLGLEEGRCEDLADAADELVARGHLAGLEGAVRVGECAEREVCLLGVVAGEEWDACESVCHRFTVLAGTVEGGERRRRPGQVPCGARSKGRQRNDVLKGSVQLDKRRPLLAPRIAHNQTLSRRPECREGRDEEGKAAVLLLERGKDAQLAHVDGF